MNEFRQIFAPDRRYRRALWVAAALLLCTFAYFVPSPAWNQNSRLALARALVEQQSVAIDDYHVTTGDKSSRNGHFYSDKAPGVAFVIAVPYAAFVGVRGLLGQDRPDVYVRPLDPEARLTGREIAPDERRPGDRLVYNGAHRLALYVCTMLTIALAALAAAFAVYTVVLVYTQLHRRALAVALTYALATPAFPYSTSLYGHQLAAALAIVAFAIIVVWPRTGRDSVGGLWTGACLGLAVMSEYPAAIAALVLVALGLVRRGWRFAAFVVAGGTPFALGLGLYHTLAFGSPWSTGYDFVYLPEFAEGMKHNYGIAVPRARIVIELLFGSYRGLFVLSPVLIAATWGLGHALVHWRERRRYDLCAAAAIAIGFVLLNAGYYMWDGGAAAGPRHLVPMLPFLALGLVPTWRVAPGACRVLTIISAVQMLVVTAAGVEAPRWGNLLWEYALPEVLGASDRNATTNIGRLLGLPMALSLLPLAVPWLAGWSRLWASEPADDADTGE